MAEFLKGAAKSKLNILISGGTGSGKTTMLNAIFKLHSQR
jgi:pilus assembly protein CpaF